MLVETEWPIKKGGWLVRINSYLAFYHFYALNIHRAAQGWTEQRQMKQNVTHFLSLCQIVKLRRVSQYLIREPQLQCLFIAFSF